MYTCVYVYIYTDVSKHTNLCMYACMYMFICTCVDMQGHNRHSCMKALLAFDIRTESYTFHYEFVYIYIYLHVCLHILCIWRYMCAELCIVFVLQFSYACMHVDFAILYTRDIAPTLNMMTVKDVIQIS